jgi:hypothetical protein
MIEILLVTLVIWERNVQPKTLWITAHDMSAREEGCVQDSFANDVVTKMYVAEYDSLTARQSRVLDALPHGTQVPKVCSSAVISCNLTYFPPDLPI